MTDSTSPEPSKKPRGFAAMSIEKRKLISSKGGKAAHEMGVAHRFTSESGREAGKKGGESYRRRVAKAHDSEIK